MFSSLIKYKLCEEQLEKLLLLQFADYPTNLITAAVCNCILPRNSQTQHLVQTKLITNNTLMMCSQSIQTVTPPHQTQGSSTRYPDVSIKLLYM